MVKYDLKAVALISVVMVVIAKAVADRFLSLQRYERHAVMEKYGMGLDDSARFESVDGIVILTITIPTGFWTFLNAFRYGETLRNLRLEAEKLVQTTSENGVRVHTVNVSRVRDSALLTSHLQESIRHHSAGAGTRFVHKETVIQDQYLLKKDGFLIMPNRPMHFNEASRGPWAKEFRSDRFSSQSRAPPGTFRGFGGGSSLCPGRHFAMTGILTTLVMALLRYDIEPVADSWSNVRADESNMSQVVTPPLDKVMVRFTPRTGWDQGRWKLIVEG